MFDLLTRTAKPVIGMVHIGALPGSPLYDPAGGMGRLIDGVLADLLALQEDGIDAVMFGNENDRPYVAEGAARSRSPRCVPSSAPSSRC